MNKDQKFMLITAIVSALCVVWAIIVEAYFIAAGLVLNTLFCLYGCKFQMKDKKEDEQ